MEALPPAAYPEDDGRPILANDGEELMRWSPCNSRCLPFSFVCSIVIASVRVEVRSGFDSEGVSTTTESIERGSMM